MESVRELRISRQSVVFRKLQTAVLAAPDVDVDVFKAQLETVGRLSPPLIVLVSPDDLPLDISGFLAGGRQRVGNSSIRDFLVLQGARRFGVRVIDISSIEGAPHDRFEGVASIFPALKQELEDRGQRGGTSELKSGTMLVPVGIGNVR